MTTNVTGRQSPRVTASDGRRRTLTTPSLVAHSPNHTPVPADVGHGRQASYTTIALYSLAFQCRSLLALEYNRRDVYAVMCPLTHMSAACHCVNRRPPLKSSSPLSAQTLPVFRSKVTVNDSTRYRSLPMSPSYRNTAVYPNTQSSPRILRPFLMMLELTQPGLHLAEMESSTICSKRSGETEPRMDASPEHNCSPAAMLTDEGYVAWGTTSSGYRRHSSSLLSSLPRSSGS